MLKSYAVWITALPVGLVRFIGIAEMVGAVGLILPVLTGVVPGLTVTAASGLALVMVGATVFHVRRKEYRRTALTLALLSVALFVVVGPLFTDWPSITPALGSGSQPMRTRRRSRKAACTLSQVPSSLQVLYRATPSRQLFGQFLDDVLGSCSSLGLVEAM